MAKSVHQKLMEERNIVSIQGYRGCFHQEAAEMYFNGNVEVVCCDTFKDVIKVASDKKQSSGGVMAIENSIAGSILPNYNLLLKSNLRIAGEVYLQINQQLMVNKDVQLQDIKEVQSHPMALQQCEAFLDKHQWRIVESDDTALSAKKIARNKSKSSAAIASKVAARIYNLDIIAPNIHTLKNNYTRFLILQRAEVSEELDDANKASVYFHTDNSKGSLARVLVKISEAGINLSKLQSFPIPGSDWKYSFHADMEFADKAQFFKLIKKIDPLTEEIKIYGIYKNGKNSK